MPRYTLVTLVVLASISLSSQSSRGGTAEPKPDSPSAFTNVVKQDGGPTGFSERNPRYTLQAGDVFDIVFEFSPEFSQTVMVQPDGFVNFKGVGDQKVGGLTTPEVVAAIKKAYSKILKDPAATISLKEFEKPSFVADGMVTRPGKYPLRTNTTLFEAIAIAGGVNDSAKQSQVLIFRRVSDKWMETKVVDLHQMLKNKDLSEDIVLQPGDLIYVPQTVISKYRRYIPAPGVGMSVTPPL